MFCWQLAELWAPARLAETHATPPPPVTDDPLGSSISMNNFSQVNPISIWGFKKLHF